MNMFKVNNKDTRTTSDAFIVNFRQISHIVLVFDCWFKQVNVSWVRNVECEFFEILKYFKTGFQSLRRAAVDIYLFLKK